MSAEEEARVRATEVPGQFAKSLVAIALGDKAYPQAEDALDHHYVSQMQLRRFCAAKPSGTLFQLDKTSGCCEPTTPKKAARESRLYTVQSVSGEDDGLLEAIFGLAENYAAQALERFLRDPAALSEDDRADLAFLVVLQDMRVPGFLDEHADRLEAMVTIDTVVALNNVRGRKRREAEDLRSAILEGKIGVAPPRNLVLRSMLEALPLALLVKEFPWMLIRAPRGTFVCSDRPVTRHDPASSNRDSASAWQSSPTVQTMIPLASTSCLRISPGDTEPLALRLWTSARAPFRINLRTYGWATRYVYGSSADTLEELHAYALGHPEEVPEPARPHFTIVEDIDKADPAVATRNIARGRPPSIVVPDPDGTLRAMSYERIESVEDARRAVSPRAPTR